MSTKENVEVVESSSDNTTLKDKLIHLMKQFFSFLLVSGVGWVMDFTIFLILTNVFGLWVMISNMISAIPAITYVFLMSNKKIFKNENSKELPVYLKTYSVIFTFLEKDMKHIAIPAKQFNPN